MRLFILALGALALSAGCRDPKTSLDTAALSDDDVDEGATDDGDADDTGGVGDDSAGDDGAGDDGAGDDGTGGDSGDDGDDTGDETDNDADDDGYDDAAAGGDDCDDADAEVNPGAEEVPYDGVDNDCDELTADDDLDGDGFGADEDCDDGDAAVNPGAEELAYDGVDNDCDELTADDDLDGDGLSGAEDCDDEDAEVGAAGRWYLDEDEDGYGNAALSREDCEQPEGYVADFSDCDDGEDAVHPGAAEICDGLDNDCDGSADVGAIDETQWFYDGDEDGFGGSELALTCDAPEGGVAADGDCDDGDPAVNPDASEICDGEDNNCDGVTDDDAVDQSTWYADEDEDTYGDPDASQQACEAPEGYVDNGEDCDDTDPALTPENACDPGDTGDTGGGYRDGTYEGSAEVTISVDGEALDSCEGTVSLDVEEDDNPQILGEAYCTLTGSLSVFLGELYVTIEGDIVSDPDVEGEASLGGDTAPWTGSFSDEDTIDGAFEGSFEVYGYEVSYQGSFTAVR